MLLTSLALMLAAAPQAPPAEITLNSEDRWALVTGLRHRLGGPFVIANLADADGACRASGVCISAAALGEDAPSNLQTLLTETEVNGKQAVAIVAMRTGRLGSAGYLRLTVSVFDAQTGNWTNKDVRISPQAAINASMRTRQRLDRYEDSDVVF